ncbi:hypothetical protein PV328_012446 [Microctonus aethiopoides]|uniref:USP domain-containing protein n=1 Tax=Microctonus aethiopoides TaxID=144406 RepID=A0AA39FDQ7_9HYME|nr:hypothetical protein PV328_012446 [Microctonus aethiopoides]
MKKYSYDLKEVLNSTFSHWYQSREESCENCTSSNIMFKNELVLTKDIIVIHFILFSLQNGKMMKTNKIHLRAVPTTKVLVAGQSYKVMNAIFHHGPSIEEGHYTSICRDGTSNGWIEVDDTNIRKTSWPRNAKNVCMLFLRKSIKKYSF